MNKLLLSQNKWKVKAQVTHLKSYVKCEISSINNKIELLFERINIMSSIEKKEIKILQEKISFIPKELTNKDAIIETLIETETSIFESVLFQKPKNKFVNQI